MLNLYKDMKNNNDQVIHDINSSISALVGAMEVIKDEWRSNPELVDKILPLTMEKLNQLHHQLENFRDHST